MRLIVEVCDKEYIEGFLSLLSIGILESIKQKKITALEAHSTLFNLQLESLLSEKCPEMSQIIHDGMQLEDFESVLPTQLLNRIDIVQQACFKKLIMKHAKKHTSYELTECQGEGSLDK